MIPTPSDNMEKAWMYWYPRVYAYFYKRVSIKYEVEELTAQTMNTAFLAKNVRVFHAYLWKVAHNYLVKFIRTKSTEPMQVSVDFSDEIDEDHALFSLDADVENTVSSNYQEKLEILKECIKNTLTKQVDLQIVDLCIYQDKNSTQVAEELQLKAPTIRKKLSRALSKLRTHCKQVWPDSLAVSAEVISESTQSVSYEQ